MYELSIKKGNLNHKRFNRTTYRPKIAVMFKVVRLPKKPEFFFAPLENQFHWDHFKYFQMLALLMVMAWGRRNISVLYRHLDDRCQPHRSRFNNFLNVGRYDYAVLLQLKAQELIHLLKPQKGDTIELILDGSLVTDAVILNNRLVRWTIHRSGQKMLDMAIEYVISF